MASLFVAIGLESGFDYPAPVMCAGNAVQPGIISTVVPDWHRCHSGLLGMEIAQFVRGEK